MGKYQAIGGCSHEEGVIVVEGNLLDASCVGIMVFY